MSRFSASIYPKTPLQQAAIDYKEMISFAQGRQSLDNDMVDLALRVDSAERNEGASSPGVDVDSIIDVIADRKIKAAMANGEFSGICRPGQMLDNQRAVGDVLSNANMVPLWIEMSQEISEKIKEMNHHDSATAYYVAEINILTSKYNRICPPQFQKMLTTVESPLKRTP
jgi:hypothetical protein